MAYVYADMDALVEYQQSIIRTLPDLERQTDCEEDLIESTKAAIRRAIEEAEDAERVAYSFYRQAEDELSDARRRVDEYNAHLEEDQEPVTVSDYYYENLEEKELEYSCAKARHTHAEETLAGFEDYVRIYRKQREDGIAHLKKLLAASGQFFERYIQKLVAVKQCTSLSGSAAAGSGQAASVGGTIAQQVVAAGKLWSESLPPEQRAAVSDYTGIAYGNINATLRGISTSFVPGYREKAILIHQALSASRIPQPCTVYRGALAAALGVLQNAPDTQLVGSFFSDSGFMSTSINAEDSFGGEIKLVIEVPQGARGAYVGYLSQMDHSESEVLFDAGAVMKITAVEKTDTGKRLIHARMLA